jgi:hypothetical protein
MRLKETSLLESEALALRQEQHSALATAGNIEVVVVSQLAWWREQAIEAALLKKLQEMECAKAEYLERRKERRQVETVLSARRMLESVERNRREQRTIDDWFGQKMRQERT